MPARMTVTMRNAAATVESLLVVRTRVEPPDRRGKACHT
jgi:hypothetical protein